MTTHRTAPATVSAAPGVRMPAMPSWWVDDEDATTSSMIAATQMRG